MWSPQGHRRRIAASAGGVYTAERQSVRQTMGSSEKASYSRVALAIVIISVAVLFAVTMLSEWSTIIVTRSSAHIASYDFGSESMMSHGGWRYSNPEVYAWTAFAEAVVAVATIPALWMIIVRRSRRAVFALVFICVAYVGAALVLGQAEMGEETRALRFPRPPPLSQLKSVKESVAREGTGRRCPNQLHVPDWHELYA